MKKIWLPALLAILALAGCRENQLFDGPSIVDQFGPFELRDSLKVSADSADFANNQTVFFTASFNKRVNWTLTITGQTSGAQKIITAFSNELNVSNATWDGTTTELPFFRAEDCIATLTIEDEPTVQNQVPVIVKSTRNYEGILVTDFETDPGTNIELGNFEFELSPNSGRQNNVVAGQGEYYWLLEGTDDVVRNFFVGLINIFPSINGETYFSVPTTIPEQLYFNALLYSDGTPRTIAVLQLATDTNGSGQYEDGPDRTFQVPGDFPLNHTGWIQVSFTAAEIGLSEAELQELVAVRVILISDDNAQPTPPEQVAYGIDYITFTQGQPLQP